MPERFRPVGRTCLSCVWLSGIRFPGNPHHCSLHGLPRECPPTFGQACLYWDRMSTEEDGRCCGTCEYWDLRDLDPRGGTEERRRCLVGLAGSRTGPGWGTGCESWDECQDPSAPNSFRRCLNCALWIRLSGAMNVDPVMGRCELYALISPGHWGRTCSQFILRGTEIPDTFATGVFDG